MLFVCKKCDCSVAIYGSASRRYLCGSYWLLQVVLSFIFVVLLWIQFMVLTPVAATDVDKSVATNRSCTALDFLFSVSSLTFFSRKKRSNVNFNWTMSWKDSTTQSVFSASFWLIGLVGCFGWWLNCLVCFVLIWLWYSYWFVCWFVCWVDRMFVWLLAFCLLIHDDIFDVDIFRKILECFGQQSLGFFQIYTFFFPK